MGVNIARFYKREKWELDCEVVTPMFLGNASQEAELRAAPFKGLLRYWWRVANGLKYRDHKELLTAENHIFGSPDDTGGKSQVTVDVKGDLRTFPAEGFPTGTKIRHPEVKNRHGNIVSIDRFLYLGYGPITGRGHLKHEGKGCFQPAQKFTLTLQGNTDILERLKTTMQCFQQFGAIGSRSRNGWGCFSVKCNILAHQEDSALFKNIGSEWKESFTLDYPHCLGIASREMLLWKSVAVHANWQEVMNELAEIYLNLRLNHPFQGGGPHAVAQDRHIFGYPAGKNHQVINWDQPGRHASSLRLIVRKERDGHRGYILHLPHLFSKEMWPNGKETQIKIWQKVHTSLDKLCKRVQFEEVQA